MNRKVYYDWVQRAPFNGRLTQGQVDGQNAILEAWKHINDRHLAYALATAFHETGGLMQPVREGFAKTDQAARAVVARRKYGKPDPETGHVYYGRGLVQLTWADNYKRMGPIVGADLYRDPDKALDPAISAKILLEGMKRGSFTGKSLDEAFSRVVNGSRREDYDLACRARRIINGTDCSGLIASYYLNFLDAIREAKEA